MEQKLSNWRNHRLEENDGDGDGDDGNDDGGDDGGVAGDVIKTA